MGTRNLTAVKVDGEYKIAQYGQWDGYPDGQGLTALRFLRSVDLAKFRERVKATRFATKEDFETLQADLDKDEDAFWKKHPELSRDAGAEVLELVMSGASLLKKQLAFAGDSLFCEWAYVVDFDLGTFEVYRGFNKEKIVEGRFKSGDSTLENPGNGYEPVKFLVSFELAKLPTEEDFLASCKAAGKDDDD